MLGTCGVLFFILSVETCLFSAWPDGRFNPACASYIVQAVIIWSELCVL